MSYLCSEKTIIAFQVVLLAILEGQNVEDYEFQIIKNNVRLIHICIFLYINEKSENKIKDEKSNDPKSEN